MCRSRDIRVGDDGQTANQMNTVDSHLQAQSGGQDGYPSTAYMVCISYLQMVIRMMILVKMVPWLPECDVNPSSEIVPWVEKALSISS